MATFLLIRHGSNDTLGKRIAGRMDGVSLNAQGVDEAERLADTLTSAGITAIYVSPLPRTAETAAPLAARLGLTPEVCDGLNEVDFGEWTGNTLPDLDQDPRFKLFNTFRGGVRIPGGELMLDTQARVVGAIEALHARHPDETVALFSHGDVIKAAALHYLGASLDLILRLEISPASVTAIEIHPWGAKVLCINRTLDFPYQGH